MRTGAVDEDPPTDAQKRQRNKLYPPNAAAVRAAKAAAAKAAAKDLTTLATRGDAYNDFLCKAPATRSLRGVCCVLVGHAVGSMIEGARARHGARAPPLRLTRAALEWWRLLC